ncbi:anti-sigma-I factor RsgI family protein [Virgibacillus sp. DJP39]|uniref:anti-sigma-I factor RsgI family protein n=1 Tax=Virgibacillus sp. DJP39 TaxID=3409790 RepID=UPI003BB7EBAF
MSKGIVMEKHRQFTIIMTPDGSFRKVKPLKGANIGAEVSYELLSTNKSGLSLLKPHRKSSCSMKYIAIACMALLFVMPFYFLGDQNKTYAYVNLDINPSIEIEIDDQLNVVAISPLNEDAQKLIKELPNYRDKKVEQLIETIMNKSDELGLTENGKNVLVGVSYIDSQADTILKTVDHYFSNHNTSWNIATFQVPKQVRKLALQQNISMNKVMADTMKQNVASEKLSVDPLINDGEKELIHSFYTSSNATHQNNGGNTTITDSDVKDESNNSAIMKLKKKSKQHPSELKKQNSANHKHGDNHHVRDNTKHAEKEKGKYKNKNKEKGKKEKQERKKVKKVKNAKKDKKNK